MADSDEPAVPGDDPEASAGDRPEPIAGVGQEPGAGVGQESIAGDRPEHVAGGGILVPDSGPGGGDGGLRWSFECDLEGLLAAAGRSMDTGAGGDGDQDEIAAAEREALDRDSGVSVDLTGLITENLPAGPGLAAWLSQRAPGELADRDLPGAAAAFRKVASWAQAAELALVAQIAVRSAARDGNVGLAAGGRPARVTADAAAQVSLGLALSACGGESWTHLAVTLGWRLPATAAALERGSIDLYRAKVIAEATTPLTDEAARAVEDKIVPAAGDLTYGQLHAAVRRAVIAADPDGAEQRRQAAERRARVSLYPDQDYTATLTGSRLPATHAAAAMAKITAMARALKAAGAGGGLDLLRAHVFLGLILGTLPLIPPPADGPPDNPPPPDDSDGDPDGGDPDGGPPDDEPSAHGDAADGEARDGGAPDDDPAPAPGGRSGGAERGAWRPGRSGPGPGGADRRCRGRPGHPSTSQETGGDGAGRGDSTPAPHPGATGPPATGRAGPWPDIPPPSDADAPEDDGYRDPPPDHQPDDEDTRYWGDPLDDHHASRDPVPAWPPVPPAVPAPPASATRADQTSRPPPGLLDLSLPWATLTCESAAPGTVGRLGPVTAVQARHLARIAATDHATHWRIIVTDTRGRATAVGRVPWARPPAGLRQPGTAGLVGRVTITIPAAAITGPPPSTPADDPILTAILRTAARADALAREQAHADQDAPGGCAHTLASAAYRPPPRVRDHITARDLTCRYPYCGQPAWRGDLDHTQPWHKGGLTCTCNLGPLCRAHHILKQLPGWCLTQTEPGTFQWTTSAGCTYTVHPDLQHV